MSRLDGILKQAVEEYYNNLKEPAPVNIRLDLWKFRKEDPVKIEYNISVVPKTLDDMLDRDFDSLADLLFFIQHPNEEG